MENFNFGRVSEGAQSAGLLAEWQEYSKPSSSDQSERLDRILRDFADSKLDNSSHSMQLFQKAIGRFCDTQDKDAAVDELSNTWSTLSSRMTVGSQSLQKELREEIARQPAREVLERDCQMKQFDFYGRFDRMPLQEVVRVEKLIKFKEHETEGQYRERVRTGLAANRTALGSFNQMKAAEDRLYDGSSQHQKDLEFLIGQIASDAKVMQEKMKEAYLRSTL
jgi:hypothetical protein